MYSTFSVLYLPRLSRWPHWDHVIGRLGDFMGSCNGNGMEIDLEMTCTLWLFNIAIENDHV